MSAAPTGPLSHQIAAQRPVERLKAPALFLLDEFAALGRLEAVERAMGLMAGYIYQYARKEQLNAVCECIEIVQLRIRELLNSGARF
ncbi:type IV secretory system conjugative DNA transfer family protein [Roseobacter sp.]|uniref:type IV secretory system conjugative DNA transfer family protein n=1 Tax=Roseobacter sp. TaxID=1907202 RepID=UPI00385A689F